MLAVGVTCNSTFFFNKEGNTCEFHNQFYQSGECFQWQVPVTACLLTRMGMFAVEDYVRVGWGGVEALRALYLWRVLFASLALKQVLRFPLETFPY